MPLVVNVDPHGEVIKQMRAGQLDRVPHVPLAGSDYEVPRQFALVYRPEANEPGWRMVFETADDGVPRCVSVHIEATETGREIRSGDLRLSVEDSLELAARNVASRQVVGWDGQVHAVGSLAEIRSGATLAAVRATRQAARRKVTDELLREVAAVYRENVNDNPTDAVAVRLGVADRTARLYVRRARDAGYLGEALRGKAGER